MEEALTPEEIWTGLAEGRWRVVLEAEAGGERLVLVRRCRPGESVPLDPRERRAIRLAARGASNKSIGFDLGIAPSTAAGVLAAAQRKLGLSSRRQLIELFGTAGRVERDLG
jgi:DNA-binding CsgD family transcriptional regulator